MTPPSDDIAVDAALERLGAIGIAQGDWQVANEDYKIVRAALSHLRAAQEMPPARSGTSVDMPDDWPNRVAVYAVNLDGLSKLDEREVGICTDAAEWAWHRVTEDRQSRSAPPTFSESELDRIADEVLAFLSNTLLVPVCLIASDTTRFRAALPRILATTGATP